MPSAFNSLLVLQPCLRKSSAVSMCFSILARSSLTHHVNPYSRDCSPCKLNCNRIGLFRRILICLPWGQETGNCTPSDFRGWQSSSAYPFSGLRESASRIATLTVFFSLAIALMVSVKSWSESDWIGCVMRIPFCCGLDRRKPAYRPMPIVANPQCDLIVQISLGSAG